MKNYDIKKLHIDEIDITILYMTINKTSVNIGDIMKKLNMTKMPIYERIKRLSKYRLIYWHKGEKIIERTMITNRFIEMIEFCWSVS